MELVSLTANIIRSVQLSGGLTSISYGYITNVAQAPKVLQDLSDELISLGKVLGALMDYMNTTPYSPALQNLAGKDGPLERCARELQELDSKLELKGVLDRIKWPLKEKETMQHISQIERHKLLFCIDDG